MEATGVMTALPASLTLRDAQSVLESLRQAFAADGGDVWRIDAAPVTQVDTSALAVLLECARIAKTGNREFEIVGAPARLSDLARLYGVDGLLGFGPKPAEAGDAAVSPPVPGIPVLR
jgi:phospholipid transport system transporter-binding protein